MPVVISAHLTALIANNSWKTNWQRQLPRVDVPLYAGAAYFRKDDSHYYLAVSLIIPGSQIPFVTEKDKDSATIDFAGVALETNQKAGRLPVGRLRDTVKSAVESAREIRRKNVQSTQHSVLDPTAITSVRRLAHCGGGARRVRGHGPGRRRRWRRHRPARRRSPGPRPAGRPARARAARRFGRMVPARSLGPRWRAAEREAVRPTARQTGAVRNARTIAV